MILSISSRLVVKSITLRVSWSCGRRHQVYSRSALNLERTRRKDSARVKHALDLYEELQNSIEENSDNFGSTMTEINKQLKNIEAEFAEFVTLNSSGDPIEASSNFVVQKNTLLHWVKFQRRFLLL